MPIEVLTGAILSGVIYDMLKYQTSLTASNLKNRLEQWVIDDIAAKVIEEKVSSLELNNDLSEKSISSRLDSVPGLIEFLSRIESTSSSQINQSHSGTGDNVGRDKIINK